MTDVDDTPAVLVFDTAFMLQAACRGMNPDLFFPRHGGDTSAAKAVCRACPVRRQCLEYALMAREHYGIWGGITERGRRRVRRGRWTG